MAAKHYPQMPDPILQSHHKITETSLLMIKVILLYEFPILHYTGWGVGETMSIKYISMPAEMNNLF